MKKLILFTIIVLVLILPGCSGKEKQIANSSVSDNSKKEEDQGTDMKEEKSSTEITGTDGVVNSDAASSNEASTKDTKTESTEDAAMNTETSEATVQEEAEPTPVPEGLVLPLTTNSSGKVMIQTVSKNTTYPYNSYIITSIKGESIVLDPTSMPKKEECNLNPVAILSTHAHPDHIDNRFTNSYECEKLLFKKGEINTADFRIYTIQSSHNGDTIGENSNNVIAVVEVDGLRIAHMGDIGQNTLTEEQLQELGVIDIAFMQFENSYSDMTLENKKGFNMMEQLKPKLIIPTHYTDAALPLFEESYGTVTESENVLEIAREDIPDQTAMIRILNKHIYK